MKTYPTTYVPDMSALKRGLLYLWDFEETTGSIAYSTYGNNNGVITTPVTLNVTGKVGQCFEYNGSYIGHISMSNSSEIYSISLWFYTDEIVSPSSLNRYVIGFKDLISNPELEYFGLRLGPTTSWITDEIISTYTNRDTVSGWCNSSDTISIGWHHLVISWNGTYYDIYLDTNKKTITNYGTAKLFKSDFKVSRRFVSHSSTYGLDGKIDQLAMWDRQLSISEIRLLYNEVSGRAYSTW